MGRRFFDMYNYTNFGDTHKKESGNSIITQKYTMFFLRVENVHVFYCHDCIKLDYNFFFIWKQLNSCCISYNVLGIR
jgi:hypothetical protein